MSVSDVVEDGLEGLGFQHHVLDEVNVEVIEVHLADGVRELVLELIDLVLQSPHLSTLICNKIMMRLQPNEGTTIIKDLKHITDKSKKFATLIKVF